MSFPLAVHNYIHLGTPCEAVQTLVLNDGKTFYTAEAYVDDVTWSFPFPAGGFTAKQDSTGTGLANWGTNSFVQQAYTDASNYAGKWPINSCDDKLNLYMEMTDGSLVGGVSQPYFTRDTYIPLVNDAVEGFTFILGRPRVDQALSGANVISSRVWRNTWAGRLNSGVTKEAGGFQGNLQLNQDSVTGDLTFVFTHPGKEYDYLQSPFNASRYYIDPASTNKTNSLVFSPGADHGWLPVTIYITARVTEIKDNWSSNFGNTNNLSLMSSSTITITVGDVTQTVTESDLFVEGNSGGWVSASFIDPVVYGESPNGASYLFDSELALGGIGTYENEAFDFYDAWVTNRGWSP